MKIFDTHAHIAYKELITDLDAVMNRAQDNGVLGLCFISAEKESLLASEKLYQDCINKYPKMTLAWSAGLHPHEAKDFNDDMADLISNKARLADAIGETGLDYHYDLSPRDIQQENFRFHIQLAKKEKKPLVIHCREAIDDILKILDEEKITEHPNPGILHCFTENTLSARKLLDRGFYISFSGILTFKNSEALRESAKTIPLDRLLIETDAPYLAPVPKRGRTNEPSYVIHTLQKMAEIHKIPVEQLAKQLWENSCKLFSKGLS
ncbi:MAG: TatD family hydrolase [Proteobacteria bacterium]|nr:TatD family hydrolase [Pseudomonadota bacterium]